MRRTVKPIAELFRPLRLKTLRDSPSTRAEDNPALQAMWEVVCRIPRGKVSTYGAVARAAGFPGRARQAGLALKIAPKEMHLPWHRVVGAGGRIVFADMRKHREQARRLRAEGVLVKHGRVPRSALTDLDDAGW